MHRPARPAPRTRGVVLVLAIALLAGLSTTVASAAPDLPPCKIGDTLTKHRSLASWYRSLLDTDFRLASSYKPSDLKSTSSAGLNGGYYVRRDVITDLKAMTSAARAADARFTVVSAYRSYNTQKSTFDYWVRVLGRERALKESARPGHSEHQLGTTLDFKSYGGKAPWDLTDWANSKAGHWLKTHAWKYGFVMSYPKGKTSQTCYTYEPWHYRYVGRARAAAIRGSGTPMRVFLWNEQNASTPTPTPTPTPTTTAEPTPTPEG